MKMIIAIIRPEMLEPVQTALGEKEVYLMTVTNVYGCGRQRGYMETFRGSQIQIRLFPKLKLEIAVNEEFVKPTIETISAVAKTGKIGDGKIFVFALEEVHRIRTGETGKVAIGP